MKEVCIDYQTEKHAETVDEIKDWALKHHKKNTHTVTDLATSKEVVVHECHGFLIYDDNGFAIGNIACAHGEYYQIEIKSSI